MPSKTKEQREKEWTELRALLGGNNVDRVIIAMNESNNYVEANDSGGAGQLHMVRHSVGRGGGVHFEFTSDDGKRHAGVNLGMDAARRMLAWLALNVG